MPATKRLDILRPIEERSEKERRDLFCERAIKNERSKRNTPFKGRDGALTIVS